MKEGTDWDTCTATRLKIQVPQVPTDLIRAFYSMTGQVGATSRIEDRDIDRFKMKLKDVAIHMRMR